MMQCTTSQSIPHHALNLRGALLHVVQQARLGGHPHPPTPLAAQPLEA